MWQRTLSITWLAYHLLTLARFLYLYLPIRLNNKHLPVQFTPGPVWGVFVLSLVGCILIFMPVLAFVLTFTSTGALHPEWFAVSVIGFLFSIVYRGLQGSSVTHLFFDGDDLFFTTYGFYEATTEVIDKTEIEGIVLMFTQFKATKNYKLCVKLEDGRLILLRITLSEHKAEELQERYCELFGVGKAVDISQKSPVNDINLILGSLG
jgi:hypothetical protein